MAVPQNFSSWNLKVLIPAGIFGFLVGWFTASMISEKMVTLLIGLMGVIFCLNIWLRKKSIQHPNKPKVLSGLFWGTLSGFTSFISHSGAPPFQVFVLPQKLQKLVFAGTATLVFAIINLAKIIPYQDLQPYTANDLRSALVLIPFAIGGTYLGAILTKKIPDALFFTLVQIALFGVSLKLIWGTKDIFFY